MQREFIITRQGRDFVLYAGLLDAAHRDGLSAIRTNLIQAPTPANGFVAICHAEVTTQRGTFSGLGDADPENAPRPMMNAIVRLAETRAKARALADAVNVAMTAIEELADAPSELPASSVAPRSPAARPVHLPDQVHLPDPTSVPGPVRHLGDPPPVPAISAARTASRDPDVDLRADDRSRPAPDTTRTSPPATRTVAARTTRSRPGTAPDGGLPEGARASRPVAVSPATAGLPATANQLDAISRLARSLGRTIQSDGITRVAASELITQLSNERFPPVRRDAPDSE